MFAKAHRESRALAVHPRAPISNHRGRVTFTKTFFSSLFNLKTSSPSPDHRHSALQPLKGKMAIHSKWNLGRVVSRFWDVVEQGWYLGFTAFGGPPVHFKIVSSNFQPSSLRFLDTWIQDRHNKTRMEISQTSEEHADLHSSTTNMLTSCTGSMSRWFGILSILTWCILIFTVPRALRRLPGLLRTRQHENVLLSSPDSLRLPSCCSGAVDLVVS